MVKKPESQTQRLRRRLHRCRVTVVGLDGIGRQVALQLASLGVGGLQLVDGRIIAKATQRMQGYPREDIGVPKVHSVANACHQVNPMLDIRTVCQRSVQGVDLSDAVLYCSEVESVWHAICQKVLGTSTFAAWSQVDGDMVLIDVISNNERPAPMRCSPQPHRRASAPTYAATVAAGLVVAQFVRFMRHRRPADSIRFDTARSAFDTK